MTADSSWLDVDDTVDFDRIFPDLRSRRLEEDEVDLVADEDPDLRAWRETLTT